MTLFSLLTDQLEFLGSDLNSNLVSDVSAEPAKNVFFRRTMLFSPAFLNELPFQPLQSTTSFGLLKKPPLSELLGGVRSQILPFERNGHQNILLMISTR